MKQITIIILALVLSASCADNKKNDSKESKTESEKKETSKTDFKVTQNYAVVFKWTTNDEKLVEDNALQQADQLLEMWNNNIVENIYFDSNAKVDKFSYFPNITFVLKAKNIETAKIVLNNLIVVKKGIATYTIYPIGNLWLKRNTDKINKNGLTKSYVSVWTTKSKPDDVTTKAQNDMVLSLWENGKVENAYFDIEGTQIANNDIDFVLFVNADSEEKAKIILSKLPFVEKNIASYELHQVGIFWMGIND